MKEIKEELAKISFSNIGYCVNTNLILDYITNLQEEIERLNKALLDIKEVLKDYGDIVGYSMYNITGEQLINILDIVNKALGSDKEQQQEIERLNNIINEIYTKALDTSITSLDLRDYIINNLGSE